MKPKSTLRTFLCIVGSSLLSISYARASDGTWNGITGNWTDTTNPDGVWSGGTPANGADSTAFFTGVDIAADQVITLNGNRSIGNIIFTDDTTSSNNLLITGNTLTLDRTDAVAPNIDVTQANRQLSISSMIAGNDGLRKSGTGTLRLTAANTFTGGLTINAGTVFVNAASGVNALSSGKVTIGDVANTGASAELLYSGTNGNHSFSNLIDVRGNGTANIRVLGFNPTFSGAVNLGNNLNVISNNNFGSTLGMSGGITGTGNLVIQSNAANGVASSAITFSGTTLNFTGTITNSGTTTSTTASHTTISAVIGTNVTAITQNSANSQLILSGVNSFNGNILISSGTLSANLTRGAFANPTETALGNTQTLGRTATISSGGTLRFNVLDVMGNGGSTPKLTLIANGGTILNGGNFINSIGPVQLNGGTLNSSGTGTGFKLAGTVTVGGSAVSTISANAAGNIGSGGVITYDVADAVAGSGSDLNVTAVLADVFGTGGVIKTGPGTMTLSSANTYTGGTRIDNGTLVLGASGLISTSAFVTIKPGATLDTSAKTTYTVPTGKPVNFGIDATGSGSTGKITAAGLNVSNATVTYDIAGPLDDAAYVLATYTGVLTTTFLSAPADPVGYTLDYAYQGDKIALVQTGGNIAPDISDIANPPSFPSGGNTGALAFTVTDEDVNSVTPSGSSNNPTLVPNSNIIFGGSGAGRTVTVTPVSGQSGTATITVTLTDNGSLTATDTFVLTVTDNFLSWATTNNVTGGKNGDSDNDGVENLIEYALVDGGERGVLSGNTITFAKRGGVYGSDLTYIIETSETLEANSWAPAVTHGPGLLISDPTISYTFTPSTPMKEFARLKVTSP